jgi:membrane-bound lytic murein transglycosylase F
MVDLSPKAHKLHIISGSVVALIIFAILVITPFYTEEPLTQLETIQQRGYINVLTHNSASTYYHDANGPNGFQYQLVKLFADYIGVKLNIIVVDRFSDLYAELLFKTGDLVAAGLSEQDVFINPNIEYGPSYHQVQQQVVYRRNKNRRIRNLEDIGDAPLVVIEGSSHERLLIDLSANMPDLKWQIESDIPSDEMIELVDEGELEFVLADSHEIALQRRFFPELRIALDMGDTKDLRWARKKATDDTLQNTLEIFFGSIKKDGRLDQLIHRFFGQVERFNYSDIQTFRKIANERLPTYKELFKREAEANNIDWHLLAAIGYQESHWNPKAKSPTGVRGLMMLTLNTAKHVKIENRLDPEQSIKGGAKYFKKVLAKIPDRIPAPDRIWLALAAYNVGFGHLEDARIITKANKGDPDKWIDVKENLPLLGRKKWYKNTKYGYARGWEPVKYVENIRKYYDLLVDMESREIEKIQNIESTIDIPLPESRPLSLPPSF